MKKVLILSFSRTADEASDHGFRCRQAARPQGIRGHFTWAWALAILLLLLIGGIGRAEVINVFFLGGQSNAQGAGMASDLPAKLQAPQEDVAFYYLCFFGMKDCLTTLRPVSNSSKAPPSFGPEITFGREMADYYAPSGEKVAVLKVAAGGSNLFHDWRPEGTASSTGDGGLYRQFQTFMGKGLAALKAANPQATLRIRGMVWMQGESDGMKIESLPPTAERDYQINLANFIKDIRLTYGKDLPFVIGRLSTGQTAVDPAPGNPKLNYIRSAQSAVAAATPKTAIIDTDSCALGVDKLHFNASGQQQLGIAFAKGVQSVLDPLASSTAPH